MLNRRAFTLIELLVVIAVIALLMAILIPVLRSARERGQRVVCLSNIRQLTLAWVAYAEDNDGKLVWGSPFGTWTEGLHTIKGWAGDKGALWPYLRDVDVYRCPRGWAGHAVTYSIVAATNCTAVEGTYWPESEAVLKWLQPWEIFGKRVGSTVLKLTNLTEIVSPGAGQRAVFIDQGLTPFVSTDFYVHYLYPKWYGGSPPPIHHHDGTTLSMADGHVEYWKWKGRETVNMPRELVPKGSLFDEILEGREDYEPQTEDGLYDLQRLQKATWGRLGYSTEEVP